MFPKKVGGSGSIELHQKLFNLLPRQERMKIAAVDFANASQIKW
jgi:hypothetical protein